jgi:hypothetical protein
MIRFSYLIEMSEIFLSKHTTNAVRTAKRSPPNAPKVWAGKDKDPADLCEVKEIGLIYDNCLFYSNSFVSDDFLLAQFIWVMLVCISLCYLFVLLESREMRNRCMLRMLVIGVNVVRCV